MHDREHDVLWRLITAGRTARIAGRRGPSSHASPSSRPSPEPDTAMPEVVGEAAGSTRARNRTPMRALVVTGITVLSVLLLGPPQASEKLARAYGASTSAPKPVQQLTHASPHVAAADVGDIGEEDSTTDSPDDTGAGADDVESDALPPVERRQMAGEGAAPSPGASPAPATRTSGPSLSTGSTPAAEPDAPAGTPGPLDPEPLPEDEAPSEDSDDADEKSGLCVGVDLLSIIEVGACINAS
jgi:hypothetical protein